MKLHGDLGLSRHCHQWSEGIHAERSDVCLEPAQPSLMTGRTPTTIGGLLEMSRPLNSLIEISRDFQSQWISRAFKSETIIWIKLTTTQFCLQYICTCFPNVLILSAFDSTVHISNKYTYFRIYCRSQSQTPPPTTNIIKWTAPPSPLPGEQVRTGQVRTGEVSSV